MTDTDPGNWHDKPEDETKDDQPPDDDSVPDADQTENWATDDTATAPTDPGYGEPQS